MKELIKKIGMGIANVIFAVVILLILVWPLIVGSIAFVIIRSIVSGDF